MQCVFLTTVFDPDVEPSKEHREIFERYKKLVCTFVCSATYTLRIIFIISLSSAVQSIGQNMGDSQLPVALWVNNSRRAGSCIFLTDTANFQTEFQ